MQRRVIEFDQGWDYIMEKGFNKLRRILEGLPESPFDADQYMMLYTITYNMCAQKAPHNYAQQIYDKYGETFEEYITSTVLPSLRDKHDEFLLQELAKRWGNHRVMVRWMSRFFHYLDFYFIPQMSLPSLNEIGHRCFLNLVYQEVYGNVRVAALGLIRKEREGEQIDRALLKTVINMFVEIGMGEIYVYEVDFEKHMLGDTVEYYSRKASRWTLEDSCADYMLKAEGCLRREKERASHYLHSSSEEKLLEKVQHELLVVYANQLLEKEHFLAFLRDGKAEDLARMHTLYQKIPRGFETVANAFQQHMTAEGTTLVQEAEEAASNQTSNGAEQVLVRKIIELHHKYMARVSDCFMNHSLFHKAIEDVLEVVCNKAIAGTSCAELFAAFCDNVLRKGGSEKLSDEAIEEELEKVVKLLPYIHEKNLFADFYWKKLARRLLFYQSANEDHEKSILTKLKQQCGGKFTSKMEGMLTDLALARDNQAIFEEYLRNNPNVNPGMDLSVTVLTTGFWPSYKSFDFYLPAEMMKCVQVFQEFYETERNNRKLTWVYSMGTCNIIGKFEPKEIELVVSTYQAALLLLFNTADRLSYSEISAQLNLTGDDLVRILHSLSCSKYKILIKEPNTKTISPNDNFESNSKFADRMKRIKIPLPTVDERKDVIQDVDKDRRYATDAAIVRIMKSRKVLAHRQLVVECVDQLRHMFKPDIKAIKKRIEDLEMDKRNLNMVRYLP